jgi:hypothetical protein
MKKLFIWAMSFLLCFVPFVFAQQSGHVVGIYTRTRSKKGD